MPRLVSNDHSVKERAHTCTCTLLWILQSSTYMYTALNSTIPVIVQLWNAFLEIIKVTREQVVSYRYCAYKLGKQGERHVASHRAYIYVLFIAELLCYVILCYVIFCYHCSGQSVHYVAPTIEILHPCHSYRDHGRGKARSEATCSRLHLRT